MNKSAPKLARPFVPQLVAIAAACASAFTMTAAHAAGTRSAPQPTAIEIYKMVDENGKVTYSNLPIKGAVKLDLDPITIIPAPRNAVQSPAQAAAPAPITAALATTSLPNVDSTTQRRRDDIRRRILEEEIRDEQKQLSDTREQLQAEEAARAELIRSMKAATARQDMMASLEARRAYDQREDKLKGLNESVASHETNIEAIRKELGALK